MGTYKLVALCNKWENNISAFTHGSFMSTSCCEWQDYCKDVNGRGGCLICDTIPHFLSRLRKTYEKPQPRFELGTS